MDAETMDLIGIAAIITSITTPIVLIYLAFLGRKVTHIDHAVNGKEPGAQSMVSQVDDIHRVAVHDPEPDAV
jgi:hypothetical protein